LDPQELACRYRARLVWSMWRDTGTGVLERVARRVPTCISCGREQPARRGRPPIILERSCASPAALPVLDQAGRIVAGVLASGAGVRSARGVFGATAARGLNGSVVEPLLESFLRAGLVRLSYAARAGAALRSAEVVDAPALAELARPGERAARDAAVAAALTSLEGVDHPIAADARRALEEQREEMTPLLARALAAVAVHAASGDVLAERVFSAARLGSSKALARVRRGVEQRLGSLDALGIREGGAVTLVGGQGTLRLEDGFAVDLAAMAPFVGLSRETTLRLSAAEVPAAGLVAVENFTVFEACCRGEVAALQGATYVWTAGYPGRGVRAIFEAAASAGARIRAWCDLDLDGVRISRIVHAWAPGCEFFRMHPTDLRSAETRIPMTTRAEAAVRRDLATAPDAPLASLLAEIVELHAWAEQEVLLGGEPFTSGPRR
jgi:hypothetical protein